MNYLQAHVCPDPGRQDTALDLRFKIRGLFAVRVGPIYSNPIVLAGLELVRV